MQVKIGMIAAILCLGSAAASGCKGSFPTAPPTLAAPTAVATATPAGSAAPAPTVTPDAEQEIHFTDINLETVVREKIGTIYDINQKIFICNIRKSIFPV